ncbi:uncharacterized protein LOC123540253 isoform X1 [Mercenaria mercenaria]|uniref:uncharacterized protein LOC123540253 isoform X1 n=1 Tax=Mercenaria mercenaria TaxID=6596 RepID=UPI00234F121C|nr:uncharacterized protein LOC123540253 isoform X1 [Mercenaria mercenaria]XP_045181046.2 uncharacterized protein LOC123540253 isoform X1 [Mercenaria mercenaria]XP_045181047.2 uncharacterized protein LOC123540253 isoform X1 [Mercenaria mercenaria]XP_053383013.1 uncharacterized protein LOC123540253 isoform X1 [Mercenaria mercenaria]
MSVDEHAHTSIDDIEEHYEEKDDSRPFFQRQYCEVGIYITIYDAIPVEQKSIGLEHFFRMKTTEILYDEFAKMDTVNIRAEFVDRNILTDMYIERFEPGIVMAVGFDTVKDLDELWSLYKDDKLSSLIHDILITTGDLKAASITEVTLQTKLWEDEYDICKQELASEAKKRPDIQYRPNDMKMVHRLKDYQKIVAEEILRMRDLDNEIELNRNEFMNCIRNLLSEDVDRISSLKEYEILAKSSKAQHMFHKKLLDLYSSVVEKWRQYYNAFGKEIVIPLKQLHRACENEKQRDIKAKIITSIEEMQTMLQEDFDLQKISHPETEKKMARREYPVFRGLLSLIPMGAERLSDIDILMDDYMREFNLESKA